MSLLWRTFSKKINVWSVGALFGSLLLLAPFIAVFAGILQDNAEWSHIAQTVLPQYLINTVILIFGVSLVTHLVFAYISFSIHPPGLMCPLSGSLVRSKECPSGTEIILHRQYHFDDVINM